MMAHYKRTKNTHYLVYRRGADGHRTHDQVAIVKRAPLRAETYSPAEKFMLCELALLFMIDQEHVWHGDADHLLNARLAVQKCKKLVPVGLHGNDMVVHLIKLKIIQPTDGRQPKRSDLVVTPKGKRHIKRQPRRLQLCAQKLIYTNVLDKLVRAVG
jgi:hypothetical protein